MHQGGQAMSEHTTRRNPEMERYVEVRPVVMQGYPDAHHVFLKVTSQSFCVTPHGCETKAEAEWTRDMLCTALARIIADSNSIDDARDMDIARQRLAEIDAHPESLVTLSARVARLRSNDTIVTDDHGNATDWRTKPSPRSND
jgi:hypothetical protein